MLVLIVIPNKCIDQKWYSHSLIVGVNFGVLTEEIAQNGNMRDKLKDVEKNRKMR